MATYLHTLDRFGTCGLVDGSYVCPYHAVVTLDELDIYGSTRLGTYEPAQNLIAKYDVMLGYKEFKVPVYDTVTNIGNLTIPESDTFSTHLGQKKYELNDHLGNVITTISDRKLEIAYSDTLTNYTMPDVVASQDYYAFGMQMPGRIYQSDDYRFGFNGKERDDDMKGEGNSLDYGARIYDSRLGRWLSLDPEAKHYVPISPYVFSLNSVIIFKDDNGKWVVGTDGKPVTFKEVDGKIQWSDNAGPDVREVGELLMKVPTGKDLFLKLDAAANPVNIVIDRTTTMYYDVATGQDVTTPNENTQVLYGLTRTENNEDGSIKSQTITLYDKNINTFKTEVDPKTGGVVITSQTIGREKISSMDYTTEEFRGSVAAHEATHVVDDGSRGKGKSYEQKELLPNINQLKYLKERKPPKSIMFKK